MVELITKLELVLQKFFPLLGELCCLAVLDVDLSEFVEETLLPLELVHGSTLFLNLFLNPISLINEIVINFNELGILDLIDMWALPKIQS